MNAYDRIRAPCSYRAVRNHPRKFVLAAVATALKNRLFRYKDFRRPTETAGSTRKQRSPLDVLEAIRPMAEIQALNRAQPILPMRPGLPVWMTHDYRRLGTTSLFAAVEVARSEVLGRCFPYYTHAQFLEFLESIRTKYPRREIDLTCDNYGTHKHPAVRKWLWFTENPRFHVHSTLPSASWLNLVESWFALTESRTRPYAAAVSTAFAHSREPSAGI